MAQLILKQEIVEKINKDPELYVRVAKALGIGAPSMIYQLRVNSTKLTQASVMMVLRDYLGTTQDSQLLEETTRPVKMPRKIKKARAKQVA